MSASPTAGGSGGRLSAVPTPLGAVAFASYLAVALFDGSQSELATATLAVIAWWSILVALIVAGVRLPRGRGALAAGSLAFLTVLIGASAAWAGDDGRVAVDLVRGLAYTGALLILLVAVRAGRARDVLGGLAAALATVALIALGSRMLPDLLTGDRSFLEQFPQAVRGRLSYPIGYWNGLAACMAGAVVLLGWVSGAAGARRGRALAVAAIPPVLLALYLTGSRGGLLAAAVGLVALLALVPVRTRTLVGLAIGICGGLGLALGASTDQGLVEGVAGRAAEWWMVVLTVAVSALAYAVRSAGDRLLAQPRTPRLLRGRALAAIAVAALVGLGLLANGIERASNVSNPHVDQFGRGQFTGRFLAAGSNGRLQLWDAALDAFAAEPVHGIGAGAYGYWWNQHGTLAEPARDAHSLFFETLAELGPAGLAAVLLFFGSAVAAIGRRTFGDRDGAVAACAGLLAAGAVGAAVDWTWEIPAAFALPLVAVGLVCGRATARPGDHPVTGTRSTALRGGGVVVALACLLVGGTQFLGQRSLDRSRELAGSGDLGGAAKAARDAASLQPYSSEPWFQLGLTQYAAGDLEAATDSLEEAESRSPESPQVSLVLGLFYQVGKDPRLDEQRQRTLQLLPRDR